MFQLGLDRFLNEPKYIKSLKDRKVAVVLHPASVDQNLNHSLDLMMKQESIDLCLGFGPQHGMRGEKQDNMIESQDFVDPQYDLPILSLYGEHRRLTPAMLDRFDVLIIDLQDVGCRIYTFLTTLFYLMEDCAKDGTKELWVLDRPNPAGRPIEGNYLDKKFLSFIGAAEIPMRHGLTLGEAALWYKNKMQLDLELKVVEMKNYDPQKAPHFGWPGDHLAWVNPSPNIPRLTTVANYCGTVLLEGTQLSEGRGTTIPLELIGAPNINIDDIVVGMKKQAPDLFSSCRIRPCFFEPTFQKHCGKICTGIQIHVDPQFYDHLNFKPYRIVSLFLKELHRIHPDFSLWKDPPYEYETQLMPIDILSGNDELRIWVEDATASWESWDQRLKQDEVKWLNERSDFLRY